MNENQYQEIEEWIESTVYVDVDPKTGEKRRRDLILDNDLNRVFFFSDPLDFDRDDTHKPARYWIDECEGYKAEWHEMICDHFLN